MVIWTLGPAAIGGGKRTVGACAHACVPCMRGGACRACVQPCMAMFVSRVMCSVCMCGRTHPIRITKSLSTIVNNLRRHVDDKARCNVCSRAPTMMCMGVMPSHHRASDLPWMPRWRGRKGREGGFTACLRFQISHLFLFQRPGETPLRGM